MGRGSEEKAQSNAFSPQGSEVLFESQTGRWQLKSPGIKRFVGEERVEEKKQSILLSIGEERIGGG